ncbi:translation-associated GTPase [Candidatus Micrarchaeum sp.]|jgi:ribosome-binding ATPase YchF (GTP1/OBG family)|uniref:YchF-related putative GTPase n=1 Tax=Candidatus Micrarchaeum sp. TaxID=2282148 RepID=UPI000AA78BB9|nr:YchF-related putative GTPase [Candidatus Micrarchaeum sp.]QRF73839.1 translation-associated GTPase [Candidatus Micrarchaeum sp.]
MIVGIIGAPNKGKSTLFSALTSGEAKIANYPFTTIDPNKGVAYVSEECAEKKIGKKCEPRNSLCENGMRLVPVNIIDVAGLVPGAHEGKGMGNQFLNDLAGADGFIIVVDASGRTDAYGNEGAGNPADDLEMIMSELVEWISAIIKKHMPQMSKKESGVDALADVLTVFNVTRASIETAVERLGLQSKRIAWSDEEIRKFSSAAILGSKHFIVAANKADAEGAKANENAIREKASERGMETVMCSAALELALKKAKDSGMISYDPLKGKIEILGNPNAEQKKALDYMKGFVESRGTGVQKVLNELVFKAMGNIVVYPVEDENKFSDHSGNVLPDAILMERGSTAYDLAMKIHTDIGKGMLYAIDAISKMRLAKNYVLKDGDIIKIVSTAK